MSCPDWPALHARRDVSAAEQAAWDAAVLHFDQDGCQRCRREALAVEPALIFRRLPRRETGAHDIAAMKQAVAAMRRVERLEAARRAAPSWRNTAAVAAILVSALMLQGSVPGVPEARLSGAPPVASAAEPWPRSVESPLPLVEDLDPSAGQLIQLVDSEVDLVLVLSDGAGGMNLDV